MDEKRLLDMIMELTRENERLKLKLEQYEGKFTDEKQYNKQELRGMIFTEEETEKIASEVIDLFNDDKFWGKETK